jgi:hypothetical protein
LKRKPKNGDRLEALSYARNDRTCGQDDRTCGQDDQSCGRDDLSPEEVRLCKKLSYFVAFLKYKLSSQNFY